MTDSDKAERAHALLEDDLVSEIIKDIRSAALSQFEGSGISDETAHREARLKLWAIGQLVGALQDAAHRQ